MLCDRGGGVGDEEGWGDVREDGSEGRIEEDEG